MSILSELVNARIILYKNFYSEHLDELTNIFLNKFNSTSVTHTTTDGGYLINIKIKKSTSKSLSILFDDPSTIYPIVNDSIDQFFTAHEDLLNKLFEENNQNIDIERMRDYYPLIYDVVTLPDTNVIQIRL